MSSDAENDKNQQSEDSEMKAENDSIEDSKNDSAEVKTDEEENEVKENDGSEPEEKPVNNKSKEKEKVEKEDKKVKKDETNSEEDTEGEEKDEDKDDDDEEEEEKPKKTPVKDRKKAQKNNETEEDKDGKIEIPKGKGTQLGEIARIDASISRFKNDDLKLLHKLLFKTVGKTTMIKKNIRKFNGFNLTKDSDEYTKKLDSFDNFEVKQLKIICEMLDLEKKGSHEEMSERILDFLIEPKDSGKVERGGRPRRSAAVRANNRGYSSHDDSYSEDEKAAGRGRRNAGKRTNLKDETSSESDEEFVLSENSEEEKPVKKRKRGPGRRKKDESEDEASDAESNFSEDSDGVAKKKKKSMTSVVNNKGKVGRPRGRGRPTGSTKKESSTPVTTPGKRGRKPATSSADEGGDNHEDEGSSSEDEPLAKKTNKNAQPPTDEEIKAYVKEILDGANLEEITMKTVCKQVYAHYPDFDLTHKKAYIKTTVKSVIE